MVKRIAMLLGLVFVISLSAHAQGSAEFFGGYSYERLGSSPGRNLNGVELSGEYKFMNWLGAVADFDAHFGSPSQTDFRTLNFMVGPQISLPARISPFVHVLGGFGHVHAGGTDTSFSAAFGGGIDMRLVPMISWRVVQVDDVLTQYFGRTQNSPRISTGFVFRF